MIKIRDFNFLATHIYKEGNHCADKLAKLGFLVSNFTWWAGIHIDVAHDFNRNKFGISNFRIR